MPLYDYICKDGHAAERLRSAACYEVMCDCGHVAVRSAVNPVAIGQPLVDTRSMFRRFTEASQEIDHAATAHEQNTGQAVQTPNLWKSSLKRAKQMVAAGEAPPLRKD